MPLEFGQKPKKHNQYMLDAFDNQEHRFKRQEYSFNMPRCDKISSKSSYAEDFAKAQLKGLKNITLKAIDSKIPGLGQPYLKIKTMAVETTLNSYHKINKSLKESTPPLEAVLCGISGAAVETTVSSLGTKGVIAGSSAILIGSGGTGVYPATLFATSGLYGVSKASKFSGEKTEEACKAGFNFMREIKASFSSSS